MVGTGPIMTMRMVRSKLHKRNLTNSQSSPMETQQQEQCDDDDRVFKSTDSDEDSKECNVQREIDLQQSNKICVNFSNEESIHAKNKENNAAKSDEKFTFTRTSGIICNSEDGPGWVFPPKAPAPNIYHYINQDDMVEESDKNGFKGFRKQFSGKFKRLVSRKAETTPVIPPELKSQLKTIYVY